MVKKIYSIVSTIYYKGERVQDEAAFPTFVAWSKKALNPDFDKVEVAFLTFVHTPKNPKSYLWAGDTLVNNNNLHCDLFLFIYFFFANNSPPKTLITAIENHTAAMKHKATTSTYYFNEKRPISVSRD